jgi:hypothetical protein
MKDYINIGPVPCEEDCAQVGREGYREQAVKECTRFIKLLRKTFGDEPPGLPELGWQSNGSTMTLALTARWSAGTRRKMSRRESMRFAVRMKCR